MANSEITNIQFKRVLNFKGSINEAITCLKTKLTPPLEEGEPIIVSYIDEEKIKYFLACGVDKEKNIIRIFPSFNDLDDFIDFINSVVTSTGGITDKNISTDSDVLITKNTDGNYTIKLKDGIINASNVMYEYIAIDGETVSITQDNFNLITTNNINKIFQQMSWNKI